MEQFELLLDRLKTEGNVKGIDDFLDVYRSQEVVNDGLFLKANELNDEVIFYMKILIKTIFIKIFQLEKELSIVNNEVGKLESQFDTYEILPTPENAKIQVFFLLK